MPTPFTTKSIGFKTTKETSKIVIEKQDRVTQPGMSTPSSSSQSQSLHSPPRPVPPALNRSDNKPEKTAVQASFEPLEHVSAVYRSIFITKNYKSLNTLHTC